MVLKFVTPTPGQIKSKYVVWNEWTARVNGNQINLDLLADYWDDQSVVEFEIGLELKSKSIEDRAKNIELLATVACQATATIKSKRVALKPNGPHFENSLVIGFQGKELAHNVRMSANLIEQQQMTEDKSWIAELIVASHKTQLVNLISGHRDFPVSGFSFKERHEPDIPWKFEISFSDISECFYTSFRLLLNSDFSKIKKFETGKEDSVTRSALEKAIMSALLHSTCRAYFSVDNSRSSDEIAFESPDSVAAAARRIAVEQLEYESLERALIMCVQSPHLVEQRIDTSCAYLK